ncbi:SGNH/GDSL hydrolase family protein [Reichenbachiella carrageenanivorans]|uniref:SGNH/GDSL hydrolase family protein n=1 Tax=Reichenbachiella carrageenanivorans TaxID=2979869 RepID=A0ABY6D573_9BACT|nr:SGNH/GDSL hydrolase family protein [Reichenbachiella carrageenanivorans]UXX81314.1 SGNH/GDSL hydrolase family protein [Reichenbachiella carrageenanivorans]
MTIHKTIPFVYQCMMSYFHVIRSWLWMVICLFLMACTEDEPPKNTPGYSPNGGLEGTTETGFHYLALGDSYTIGHGVSKSQSWPVLLTKALLEAEVSMADPEVIAATGWTTSDLLRAIKSKDDLRETYDLVSLLIGVNNQFQGRSLSQFEQEYRALLSEALAFAGNNKNRVFVLSIPDYSVTPVGASRDVEQIRQEIDAFNASKKRITEEMGVQYFNITGISRDAANNPALIASDGLHPSGKMYQFWMESIFSRIKNMLMS